MAFHPAWRGARQYGAVAADLPLPTTDPGDGSPIPLGSKCFVTDTKAWYILATGGWTLYQLPSS